MSAHFVCMPRSPSRRGAVAVVVAIVFALLLVLMGLGLDTARVHLATQQLQSAADAAALAGIPHLDTVEPGFPGLFLATRSAAQAAALANTAANDPVQLAENSTNVADGDIVVGYWDFEHKSFISNEQEDPTVANPIPATALKIVARRTEASLGGSVPLLFGRLFGRPTSDLARTAIAVRGASDDPYVFVIDPLSSSAMTMSGTADITISGGAVQVNSSHSRALVFTGTTVTLEAGRINVVGGSNQTHHANLFLGAPALPDYLAGLAFPDPPYALPPAPNPTRITAAGTYDPGYYPGGIVAIDGAIRLRPGSYVLGHPGIEIEGTADVQGTAPGVTIFFLRQDATWNPDGAATLRMRGGSILRTAAPRGLLVGPYEGVAFFQQRGNAATISVSGTGQFEFKGVLYCPNGAFSMSGTGTYLLSAVNAWNVALGGTGVINGIGMPPGTGSKFAYLVD